MKNTRPAEFGPNVITSTFNARLKHDLAQTLTLQNMTSVILTTFYNLFNPTKIVPSLTSFHRIALLSNVSWEALEKSLVLNGHLWC